MNGAAAHKAKVGNRVIICAYGGFSEADIRKLWSGNLLRVWGEILAGATDPADAGGAAE